MAWHGCDPVVYVPSRQTKPTPNVAFAWRGRRRALVLRAWDRIQRDGTISHGWFAHLTMEQALHNFTSAYDLVRYLDQDQMMQHFAYTTRVLAVDAQGGRSAGITTKKLRDCPISLHGLIVNQ
ncbi:hypothetical protein CDV36_007271 [Fusarium kuroshium]|uniref:Uncharacterized protein n=1 Tax=Fusarium kuroshium TaxID=2010991 RepID=A0A3M2S675_9HYPO|nr:hypothetical protein CDV36_007271 [Fusarium kuroshium]